MTVFKAARWAKILPAMALAVWIAEAEAAPSTDLITPEVVEEIKGWANAEIVRIAIIAQNKRHAGLTEDQIITLDKQWRAERKADTQPLIAQLFGSPLSNYLTHVQAGSIGLFTEIFVMDFVGLNVGQSAVTSDYWQGDEGKFQKTYGAGPDAVFIDEAELHESSGTHRAQVNLAIADQDGAKIGAITVEVNLTELERRTTWQNKGVAQ